MKEQFNEYQKAWTDREHRLSNEKDQLADKNTDLMNQIIKLKEDHEKELSAATAKEKERYSRCMDQLLEANQDKKTAMDRSLFLEREVDHYKKSEAEIMTQFEAFKKE